MKEFIQLVNDIAAEGKGQPWVIVLTLPAVFTGCGIAVAVDWWKGRET